MIQPEQCTHEDTEPVDVRDYTMGGTITVARICLDCHAGLHVGWGCLDCQWNTVEEQRLCDAHATIHHVLARPCREHA